MGNGKKVPTTTIDPADLSTIIATHPLNSVELERRQNTEHEHDPRWNADPIFYKEQLYRQQGYDPANPLLIQGYCHHCNAILHREPTEKELDDILTYKW